MNPSLKGNQYGQQLGDLTTSRSYAAYRGWNWQRIPQTGEDWERPSPKSGEIMADNDSMNND